jgi:asparagine synthase (glutamine-hydrolysing)
MDGSAEEACSELRSLLEDAVRRSLTDGILLSGLDTSILAVLASRSTPLRAVTVALQGAHAPDVDYAALMAGRLRLEHLIHHFDEEELYDAIPIVVRTMRSFDPMEIRNSVSIYIALRVARDNGINAIMTGDGADELLAGYSFLLGLDEERLDSELRRLWSVMSFSSVPLARTLGVQVKLPYLDPSFKAFAMRLDPRYKIRAEEGRLYGKWILRKAFEESLPKEVTWRAKTPIEYGSGTNILPRLLGSKISDMEFYEKRRRCLEEDRVMIRDKEQLFYYEIYRSTLGIPRPSNASGKVCPQCNSDAPEEAVHCRTCGAYPI